MISHFVEKEENGHFSMTRTNIKSISTSISSLMTIAFRPSIILLSNPTKSVSNYIYTHVQLPLLNGDRRARFGEALPSCSDMQIIGFISELRGSPPSEIRWWNHLPKMVQYCQIGYSAPSLEARRSRREGKSENAILAQSSFVEFLSDALILLFLSWVVAVIVHVGMIWERGMAPSPFPFSSLNVIVCLSALLWRRHKCTKGVLHRTNDSSSIAYNVSWHKWTVYIDVCKEITLAPRETADGISISHTAAWRSTENSHSIGDRIERWRLTIFI